MPRVVQHQIEQLEPRYSAAWAGDILRAASPRRRTRRATRRKPADITAQIGEGGMGEVYRATDTCGTDDLNEAAGAPPPTR